MPKVDRVLVYLYDYDLYRNYCMINHTSLLSTFLMCIVYSNLISDCMYKVVLSTITILYK